MKKYLIPVALIALLAILITLPLFVSDQTVMTVAIFTLAYASAATAWNIFSGYTGYISLGHAAFYGIGSYALVLLCNSWDIQNHMLGGYMPLLLLPLVGLITAVCAVPLGWVALRTRKHTFVVITIAIFVIMQLLAYNVPGISQGSSGIFLPIAPWDASFFSTPFYYVGLALLLLALAVSWWIRHSKYGLGLLAIRDDEDRARSLGVKTERFKLSALVLSAFFVGMAGGLVAYFVAVISPPSAFDPTFDVTMALITFLGGVATLSGPVLGALLVVPIQQYITIQFGQNGLDLIIYGTLFLAIILFMPEGIVPTVRKRWTSWQAARGNVKFASVVMKTPGKEANT